MVQKENKNITILKKFKERLKSFNIDRLILFGSRANGTEKKDSDFDLLVVSKKFEGIRWNQRPLKIYLSWTEDKPLEVLCYTPQEFNKFKNGVNIINEAIKEGIEI